MTRRTLRRARMVRYKMVFDIFFKSVTEPVQAAIFVMSLVLLGFALGYWAGKRRIKVNNFNVANASFPVLAGGTLNMNPPTESPTK